MFNFNRGSIPQRIINYNVIQPVRVDVIEERITKCECI